MDLFKLRIQWTGFKNRFCNNGALWLYSTWTMGCCWWETSCLLAHTPGSCLVGTFYTPYKMTSVIYRKYWSASHFYVCYLTHYHESRTEQVRFSTQYGARSTCSLHFCKLYNVDYPLTAAGLQPAQKLRKIKLILD